jgi:pimeloyl-ACP methyl ester carboxylesterase
MPRSPRTLGLLLAAVLLAQLAGCPQFQTAPVRYAAPESAFMVVKGRRIHFVDRGDKAKPAILFIHGFASSLVVWKRLVKALEGDYRVLALDLPGFGFSDKRRGDYSPQGLADLTASFLAQRGVTRAHVVAHSWGSSVALALAHRHKQRVGRLALLGAWVYDDQIVPFLRWSKVRGLGEMLFSLFYKQRVGDRFSLAFYEPERFVHHKAVIHVRKTLNRPGAVRAALAATRQQRLAALEKHYTRINHPTLLLWGREDGVARLKYGERLSRELSQARLRVLPRCGHFPMMEAYGATLNALRQHFGAAK